MPYVDFYGGGSVQSQAPPPHALLYSFNENLASVADTFSFTTGNGAELDASVFKFGGGSMKVPGTNTQNSYDYGQHYGGSWTLEGWFRTSNFQRLQLTLETNRVELDWNTAAGTIGYTLENGSIAATDVTTTITPDIFQHWAIVRDQAGGTYSLYFNGARLHETVSGSDLTDNTDGAQLVCSQPTDIWVDDLRWSPSALYSGATYLVPTNEFPT